ncbi:MAG: CHAT domain-containing protein, partial [Siphonobacter sp.]
MNQVPSYVAAFYNERGYYYNNAGDFIQATTNYEKALNVAKQHNLEYYLAVFTNNLSTQYESLGKYKDAIQLGKEAISNTSDRLKQATYCLNISFYYLKTNQLRQVKYYLHRAEQILSQYKNHTSGYFIESEIMLYRNWGLYYAATKQLSQAVRHFDKSIQLGHLYWGKQHPSLALTYREKATALEQQNKLAESLRSYRNAMQAVYLGPSLKQETDLPNLNEGILSERELFESLVGQASVLGKISSSTHKDNSLYTFRTYQLALNLAERIRLNYDVADAKLLFSQQVALVTERAVETAYHLYQRTKQYQYLELAFNITEGTRASTLTDARREQSLKTAWIPKDMLAEENRLKNAVTSIKLSLNQPTTKNEHDSLKTRLVEQEITLDKLRQKFRLKIPEYARTANEKMNIQTIRQKLVNSKTALLSYVLSDQEMYVFIVSSEQVKWLRLPVTSRFYEAISALQSDLYNNPGISPYQGHKAAQVAYEAMFAPLQPYLKGTNRLIIIRDKELNYLPFEVLEDKSHHFLLNSYAIRYSYGATLAQIQENLPVSSGPDGILAMAPFSRLTSQTDVFRDKSLSALPA